MTTKLLSAIKVSVLALVLTLGISASYAWVGPTAQPPTANVDVPVNTSNLDQTKAGDLCTTKGGSTKCLSTAGGGGGLPSGSAGQTLRNIGGTNWATSTLLFNDGTNVGVGTVTPAEKLDVSGNIKTSAAILTQGGTHITNLPWFNSANAATGYVKLITPIVDNESNMFSIKITGYMYSGTYGSGAPVEIRCGGYAYSGYATGSALIQSRCASQSGSSLPVEIGEEYRGGKYVIVIRLGTPSTSWYYNHFTAEYIGWQAKVASDFTWVTGETTPAQTGNTHNVIVDDQAGYITASDVYLVSTNTWASQTLGVGQTWQDMRASRTWSGVYYNGTGKPISVYASGSSGGGFNLGAYVGTTNPPALLIGYGGTYNGAGGVTFIVPNGNYYKITNGGNGTGVVTWSELR